MESSSPKLEPLTLLHKTTKLLPRIYKRSRFPRPTETAQPWDLILNETFKDLSATPQRPVKLVVCGLDEWSGARDLVTALLSDPLSSDRKHNDALNNRWSDPTRYKVEISYNTEPDSSSSPLKLPSTYLTQFSVPLEISELRLTSASAPKSNDIVSQILENAAIFKADIPILVFNPLTTPLSAILSAQLPRNTILVLKSTNSQAELDAIIQQQLATSSILRVPNTRPLDIIAVDPGRAVQAITALQAEPNSLSAIQKYQDDFVGSQLSMVTRSLKSKLTVKSPSTSVWRKLALCHIDDALHWSSYHIHQVRNELDKAFIDTGLLNDRLEEALAKAERDVFGRKHGNSDKLVLDEASVAIVQAEKEMKPVMDRLTWWKMIWRVDEISSIISSAITQTWCYELEKKLIMHTGRLAVLQEQVSESAISLLFTHPAVSTAVLRNSLLQLKTSPTYSLTPEILTQPIFSRRNQLIEYPTTRLHVAGQRAVLQMTGGIVGGVGIGWAGWLGWLVGSGEGLLGFVGMETETAIGFGILSAVASIRWAAGRWEKAKKRWWQDWTRVGEGLDRDLKVFCNVDVLHLPNVLTFRRRFYKNRCTDRSSS
ncbi:hypothetical protein GALMADRAFT_69641 [Galerina marginata CBS 339.88]|uniref:Mmc1 C-terminal domain-containing protein n=1 Tax=Galerina marginata (strain CBS 339.88) TaxID=685588 RepID=A0A067SW35_GALM3|nr:hypothetical protein GALMADRAFT_69641 [Galerina marginata CBS 339.88]